MAAGQTLVAARWRAEAAQKGVRCGQDSVLPGRQPHRDLIGQQSLHLSRLLNAGSTLGPIGPAVTLPIFNGGRLRANLRGAEADRDDAVAAYDEAVTEALHQVADAAASERALTDRLTRIAPGPWPLTGRVADRLSSLRRRPLDLPVRPVGRGRSAEPAARRRRPREPRLRT